MIIDRQSLQHNKACTITLTILIYVLSSMLGTVINILVRRLSSNSRLLYTSTDLDLGDENMLCFSHTFLFSDRKPMYFPDLREYRQCKGE